jgi:hypothetical protein
VLPGRFRRALRAQAAEHVDELVSEFHRESDHGLRCWLLEFIGFAGSARALPLLIEQLHGQTRHCTLGAVCGQQLLVSREARQALCHARANGEIA